MRLNQRQIWIKCQDKTGLVEWRSHLQKRSCELYGRNRRNKKKQDAKEPSHQHPPDARSDQKKGFLDAGFQDPLKVCTVRTSLLFPLLAKENPGALSEAMTRYSRLCPAACHCIYWAAAHCAHQHVANCSHMPKA